MYVLKCGDQRLTKAEVLIVLEALRIFSILQDSSIVESDSSNAISWVSHGIGSVVAFTSHESFNFVLMRSRPWFLIFTLSFIIKSGPSSKGWIELLLGSCIFNFLYFLV